MTAVPDAPNAPEPETAEPETAAGGSVTDIVLGFARGVLKEPGLGEDDDFFDAGGNSLNGTQLVARINEHFGTDFEVLDLFDLPDLRSLADAVAGAAPQAATPRPDDGQEEGTARGGGGGDVREGPCAGSRPPSGPRSSSTPSRAHTTCRPRCFSTASPTPGHSRPG
ncbi:acyl carrier protein [Streptomyces aureus]